MVTEQWRKQMIVLFPSDFNDIKKVEPDYAVEYEAVCQTPGYCAVLFNYDEFVTGKSVRMYPHNYSNEFCIYRGWMLKPDKYKRTL